MNKVEYVTVDPASMDIFENDECMVGIVTAMGYINDERFTVNLNIWVDGKETDVCLEADSFEYEGTLNNILMTEHLFGEIQQLAGTDVETCKDEVERRWKESLS